MYKQLLFIYLKKEKMKKHQQIGFLNLEEVHGNM